MDKSKVYMQILICSANNTSTMTFYVELVHARVNVASTGGRRGGGHRHKTGVQGHVIQYTQACDLCKQ